MLGAVVIVEVVQFFVVIEANAAGRIPSGISSRVATVWRWTP